MFIDACGVGAYGPCSNVVSSVLLAQIHGLFPMVELMIPSLVKNDGAVRHNEENQTGH